MNKSPQLRTVLNCSDNAKFQQETIQIGCYKYKCMTELLLLFTDHFKVLNAILQLAQWTKLCFSFTVPSHLVGREKEKGNDDDDYDEEGY